MKNRSIFFLVIILFTASCCKEDISQTQTDSNGIIISLPAIWSKSLHLNGAVSSDFVNKAIYYDGNIVIPTTNGGNNRRITLTNPNNGDYIWHWDDRYQPATEYSDFDYYHQNNNLLTWQTGKRSYCINLNNGQTQWKTIRDSPFAKSVSGLQDYYFSLGESTSNYFNYQEWVVFKGNLQTGSITEELIPNFSLQYFLGNRIGDVTRIEPYFKNGVQYYVIIWQELTDSTLPNFQSYLGLYSTVTNSWIYEKKIMNNPNFNGVLLAQPAIIGDKIYANIGKDIVCHDLTTGNQIWTKTFSQDFMFSGFIIEENRIIANCEDTFTYCLNPVNGETLWKTQSSGTSGKMSYLNGVIYFVGGSSDKLHAIDVANGKMLWKLDAEKLGEPANSGFKTNAVYVFPAENNKPAKVIALSHLNVYCFEAYK